MPSRDECLELLRKSGCSEEVIAHCEAVCRLALSIGKRCRARMDVIEAGALLHDLGRCRTHSILHAVEGARIAEESGVSKLVGAIIENHIGAGIPKEEAERLGLPSRDFIATTLEEKIVAHADNLVDGVDRVGLRDAVSGMVRRGLTEGAKRMLALHEELSKIAGIDIDDVR
ncbi:MAG: HDIG domain-containing protein [Methanobacteriota archaeon]|nr:MAG: HDIG domain-containing protein [Euryarchaeota archaeon]